MKRSRSAFVALGLLVACPLVGLVAGCSSGDPQPKVAPSSPVSASASASSSGAPSVPVEPVMPAAAKKHTAAGAEAFVRFYWEMADYAQATGDTSGLKPLGEGDCGACAAGMKFIVGVYEAGGSIRGGETSLSHAKAHRFSAGGHRGYQVAVEIANERQVVHYPDKRPNKVYPAATIVGHFILEPARKGWAVAYWTTES